jgi:hypothetical protein
VWSVEFHDNFEPEFPALESAVQDALLAVAKLLSDYGPQLSRPYADTLKGSEHTNLKELRFEASGGELRVAFAFDPRRRAFCSSQGTSPVAVKRAFTGNWSQRRTNGFQRAWIA